MARDQRPPPHQARDVPTMLDFLEVYGRTGDVTAASRRIGVSTTTAHVWKNLSKADPRDPRFLIGDPLGPEPDLTFYQGWERAREMSLGVVESVKFRLATGYDEPVVFQGQIMYEEDRSDPSRARAVDGRLVWPPRLDDLGQPIPLTVRKYDSRSSEFILKARHPEYMERSQVDVTSGGKPIAVPQRFGTAEEFLAQFGRKVGE